MQLIFTKGAAKHDTLAVLRHGTSAASIQCPKQGIIPHDMVHFAVESVLHKRGFIQRILDGEPAALQMAADSESDGVERLVEVFQADGWAGWNSDPADLLDLYRTTCMARGCEPLAIRSADLAAVRRKMLELTAQWQAVAVGESLVLRINGDPDFP